MSKSWHISRRSFLKGVGASLALPYLDIMGSTSAKAVATPPTRLACIFQPNGVFPEAWDVTGVGKQFELSPILKPLQNLKRELTVLSNLDNTGKGHVQMTGAFLTGKTIEGDKNAVSLDQMVAQAIGKETPFPSVILGTEPPRQGNAGRNPISFAKRYNCDDLVYYEHHQYIIHTPHQLIKNLVAVLLSVSLSVIEGVWYFRTQELIVRYSSIYLKSIKILCSLCFPLYLCMKLYIYFSFRYIVSSLDL